MQLKVGTLVKQKPCRKQTDNRVPDLNNVVGKIFRHDIGDVYIVDFGKEYGRFTHSCGGVLPSNTGRYYDGSELMLLEKEFTPDKQYEALYV